jgi:uncharacterized protein
MESIIHFLRGFAAQFTSPTLAFLMGGMLLVALGSKLQVPQAIYQFIVFMLLMRIGLKGGMEIREAELGAMLWPALIAALMGVLIVVAGSFLLGRLRNMKKEDGIATSGLFGAVSASTLAAAMVYLDEKSVPFEAWVPALYPFMDIPALVTAIVLANMHLRKQSGGSKAHSVRSIVRESLQGSALSALILGMALGLFARTDGVFDGFYDPLFKGFLSVLMLIMGMEAYSRLSELRKVAHWYAVYGFVAPLAHGLVAFGLGYLAHLAVGFSPGGIILLSVIAASSSDISGPPTLRASIPSANPSAYIGASTSIGTPVAIAIGIPLYYALAKAVFGF